MAETDPIAGLGKLQKQILLWLGEESGVTTLADIRKLFPKKKQYIQTGALSPFNSLQQQLSEIAKEWEKPFNALAKSLTSVIGEVKTIEIERDEFYLRDDYFALQKKLGVRWRPKKFLGHSPTSSESVSLSESLKRLEERELVTLHRLEGKKVRVSHISLTPKGMATSVKLRLQQEATK